MEQIIISILLAVYNGEKYIKESIDILKNTGLPKIKFNTDGHITK